ncbi:glutarate dioxygenase GlaH [Brevibacillus sp. SIMBA_040]|uniref:glutarate dioxygenase GlaH n=1 Tax=unclassified Brevibacillus TaxID=2684853 RepID=UPI0039788D7A
MSIVQEKQALRFLQKKAGYEIKPHPHHNRLYHIEVNAELLGQFFDAFQKENAERLQYVPFMRYIMAGEMRDLFGQSFVDAIRGILHDRQTGGFTIGVQGQTTDTEDYVKFATALTHLVGSSNFDAMSGTFYARFTVKDTDNSDSYLRQAYRLFTLHTDGTFVDEPTDWLLMMKMDERNAVGGESRLLHLDDWEELEKFSKHPLASYKFLYKAPASKNVEQVVYRPTFFENNNGTCICFIDQFVQPETIDQATYLKELSDSMENSPATHALKLPVGDLVMLNNTFWLHGRAAFEKHPELHRELMRQRGMFAK